MSITAVIGWQAACDYPRCEAHGPRCWTFDDCAWTWRRAGGLAVQRPGSEPAVVMCQRHAMTACCRCGTRDDLAVTDTDARRSWCTSCWGDVAGADLTASNEPGVYRHQTTHDRLPSGQPATKSEGIES